ncbi:MAG: HTH domain-containing protein [Fibrobacter sp.]|jgi:predicted HTH transcriptional regulator|nr:HTH domain-containing protein [Fibrobacter sp.]
MIVANAYITAEMIAKKINVTDKTIKRDIELLKKQKIIVRIGSRKNGYWKVNDV